MNDSNDTRRPQFRIRYPQNVVARKEPVAKTQNRRGMSDEELDHTPLQFGKYKGQTPSQIAEHDPRYLIWLAGESDMPIASDLLVADCQQELDE